MAAWRKSAADALYLARLLAHDRPSAQFEGARPTLRRVWNLYRLKWEWYHLATELKSSPARLCIEASAACNLECPYCFTGAGERSRPPAMLSLELYRRLLAELGSRLWQIEFHNWGEPMLNKHLFTMVREATARGLSTAFCTNFSLPFDAAQAETLVTSGLKLLGVSIDGARQRTYEQYRIGGRLDTVLRNCRLVVEAKRRLGSPTPRMIWGYHVFGHNRSEVDEARTLATGLGMDFHASRGRVVGPDWDPDERWMPHDEIHPLSCFTLWHTAVVFGDGSVASCRGSFDRADDMAHLAADGHPGAASFAAAWNAERFRLARRFFSERTASAAEQEHVCFNCPYLLDWHDYCGHLEAGGTPTSWRPKYDSNQRFNYFWTRLRSRAISRAARTA